MKTSFAVIAIVGAWMLGGCAQDGSPAAPSEVLETPVHRAAWDGPGRHGSQLQTKNYAIYTTCQSGDLPALLPAFMEASHRNYLRLLGLSDRSVGELLPVYMLSSREEWVSLTKMMLGGQAGPYLQIQSGGYCYRNICVFWDIGAQATLSVAGHEGFHQYQHHRLADQLPMWLEEGLCTQAEAFQVEGRTVSFDARRNLSRRGDLENAMVSGYWIPIDKLLPMDAGDAMGVHVEKTVGYYGQLWALVQFLRSDPTYAAGLQRFIDDAEAGRLHQGMGVPKEALAQLRANGKAYNQTVSAKLFRYYITDDLPAFENRYKAYCLDLLKLR